MMMVDLDVYRELDETGKKRNDSILFYFITNNVELSVSTTVEA
jgi:hypothetical protein